MQCSLRQHIQVSCRVASADGLSSLDIVLLARDILALSLEANGYDTAPTFARNLRGPRSCLPCSMTHPCSCRSVCWSTPASSAHMRADARSNPGSFCLSLGQVPEAMIGKAPSVLSHKPYLKDRAKTRRRDVAPDSKRPTMSRAGPARRPVTMPGDALLLTPTCTVSIAALGWAKRRSRTDDGAIERAEEGAVSSATPGFGASPRRPAEHGRSASKDCMHHVHA